MAWPTLSRNSRADIFTPPLCQLLVKHADCVSWSLQDHGQDRQIGNGPLQAVLVSLQMAEPSHILLSPEANIIRKTDSWQRLADLRIACHLPCIMMNARGFETAFCHNGRTCCAEKTSDMSKGLQGLWGDIRIGIQSVQLAKLALRDWWEQPALDTTPWICASASSCPCKLRDLEHHVTARGWHNLILLARK